MMNLKGLISGKNTADKVIDAVNKVLPDTEEKTKLVFEIYKIISQSLVSKWVRAITFLFLLYVYFCTNISPEKLKMAEYGLFAGFGYYFLVDKAFNHVKYKK